MQPRTYRLRRLLMLGALTASGFGLVACTPADTGPDQPTKTAAARTAKPTDDQGEAKLKAKLEKAGFDVVSIDSTPAGGPSATIKLAPGCAVSFVVRDDLKLDPGTSDGPILTKRATPAQVKQLCG